MDSDLRKAIELSLSESLKGQEVSFIYEFILKPHFNDCFFIGYKTFSRKHLDNLHHPQQNFIRK